MRTRTRSDIRSRRSRLGFDASPEDRVAIWEANARKWPRAGPPWRPSPGDVAIYRRLIATANAAGRVVVFGVTPELRDLLAEGGSQPILVDASAAMHAATSRLLQEANPAREEWIQADWRESGLRRNSVDLLLGDMMWWGLSIGAQHELRDAIHALLKPGGLLLGRVRFTDTTRAAEDPVPVVRAFLQKLDAAPSERDVIRGALLSWLYDHTENPKRRILDRERTRDLLVGLADRADFARHREFLTTAAGSLIGADWTSQSRTELLSLIRRRFDIIDEAHADDYESVFYPVLALRPT